MKRNILYIIGLSCLFASCVEEKFNDPQADPGKEVRFSVTVEEDLATKTIYGEESTVNGVTSVPVNWIEGDKISVYGETCYIKQAEYEVKTGGNVQNFASSLDKTGSAGVQWGDQPTSDFYAVYPSTNASFKTTDGETVATTSISSTQNNVFELSNGTWIGKHFGTNASNPSMHEAIMYARTEGASPIDKNGNPTDVKLHFKPFTTVLKFRFVGYTSNLSNPTVYVQNITVTAPDGVAIAGKFDLDIEGSGSNASATAVASKTEGETSNTISVNTILPGGTYLPLKPNQAVEFNVFTIPQGYSMNGTDKLWTVTINTQGHGSFTYKMKPLNNATYNLVAGQIHKVKVPNLQINTKIEWNPENWITQIPVPVYISELSVPGAWYCFDSSYQSVSSLDNLVNLYGAGIRAFNIDCRIGKLTSANDHWVGMGCDAAWDDDSDYPDNAYLVCAGTDKNEGISIPILGSYENLIDGIHVIDAVKKMISIAQAHKDEYIVIVFTFAEKPKTVSNYIYGSVNPIWIMENINKILSTEGIKEYLYTNISKDTTIDDVIKKQSDGIVKNVIVKINHCSDDFYANVNYSSILPSGIMGSFGSMSSKSDYNLSNDIITNIAGLHGETVYSKYFTSMQTDDIYNGNIKSNMQYCYHQAQETSSSTVRDQEGAGIPSLGMRMDAIDDIISKSKAVYDAAVHDHWFQLGIGGSVDGDNPSGVSNVLNPYLYGKILKKMDTDPSPVGIVLMNHATSTTKNTINVDGTSYTASSQDLVKAIIEMNGKFYLNRQDNSVTTGGTNDSGSGTTNPSQAKNGAYAVVGDNAF